MISFPNPARLPAILTLTLAAALLAPPHARAQWPPDSLTNLEVLPQDIEVRALVDIMAGFTRALGVRCQFCHEGEEGMPLAQFNFPSDDKATKRKAREMLRMVETINDTHLASLEERSEPPIAVACATCHRGVQKPRPLVDILTLAYEEGGLEAATQEYNDLRGRYYGRASYDFGVVTLTEVANAAQRSGSLEDAVEIMALNLEHNPDANFAQRMFASRSIELVYRSEGIEAGNLRFAELKERFGIRAFREWDVNTLGFRLLRSDKAPEAIAVFEQYVELYPESANAYDSLGEAYMTHGDTELAISSYETSLELNPNNTNAEEKLRELQSGG
jgi:tetratricopeptide (TPR) repeat protein